MYNSIVSPGEKGEQGEEEWKVSDCLGRPEVVFLVKLICTAQWGGEGEEVQMEKCLAGDVGVTVVRGIWGGAGRC